MAYPTHHGIHDGQWEQILKLHWKYIELEETMEKIELRRELEDAIQTRLGMVAPNDKFLLPSTRIAFDSSVARMENFSAYKASIGFEAISQYANNLFVKPWRKEYKVIKMYSGFYQHEIAANLLNAEKLFQDMGYQLMPNKTLVLEGPICPDQVMNVARDAITAFVECQMMKQIYSKVTALQCSVDWFEIYSFRTKHAADVDQTAKQLVLSIQEKHNKHQLQAKLKDMTTYGNNNNNNNNNNSAPALAPASRSACSSCNMYQFPVQNQAMPMLPPPPASYCGGGGVGNGVAVGSSQLYNSVAVAAPCSIHSQQHHQHHHQQQQQQQQQQGSAYGGMYHAHPSQHLSHHHQHHLHPSSYQTVATASAGNVAGQHGSSGAPALGTMPHSKSLDHYQDAASAAATAAAAASMYDMNVSYMQRHSIDQPYHYTPNATPYGGAALAAAGVISATYEGHSLPDGMLPCGGQGGGGSGGSAVGGCSNNHHPYNNVPGTNGRYQPSMLPYGAGGDANFPLMGPASGAMYLLNGGGGGGGGGGATPKQNGNLTDSCYRHAAAMNGACYVGPQATAAYPSNQYRMNNGQMASSSPYCQMPDPTMMYGMKHHAGSSYDPTSSSMATQTVYPNAPQPGASILSSKAKTYDDYDVPQPTLHKSSGGGRKLERYQKNAKLLNDFEDDIPLPEALIERNNHREQGHHQHQHHHHYLHHQTSRNSRQSDFDSYEDEQQQQQQHHLREPSSASRQKNQDGIGCYESWSYVYQNLEKQGYSKDLGERGDFLADELGEVECVAGRDAELDVDVRHRRSKAAGAASENRQQTGGSRRESTNSSTLRRSQNEKLKAMKPKAADRVDGIMRQSMGTSQKQASADNSRRHERQPSSGGGSGSGTLVQKIAKASLSPQRQLSVEDLLGLEHPPPPAPCSAGNSSRRNSVTKRQQGASPSPATKESNNNSTTTGILVNHHHHHGANAPGAGGGGSYYANGTATSKVSGGSAVTKKKTATFDTGAATIINPSPALTPTGGGAGVPPPPGSEWNCNFCTFLNPDVKRICDMCSKSRDFRPDGPVTSNGSATCV